MAGDDTRVCERIWNRYRRTQAVSLRNWLIQRYLPIVPPIAESLRSRLPRQVQLDELISAGHFGLIYAIARFDPTKGVKFETYCHGRVQGAMRDHLRGLDFKSRTERQRWARFTETARTLAGELGRAADHAEIRARLKVDEREFRRVLRAASGGNLVSLSQARAGTGNARPLLEIDTVVDHSRAPADSSAEREDLRRSLLKGLSRRDRLILTLYYYEGLTLREIGDVVGVTESRISQRKEEILELLRAREGRNREQDLLDVAA